MGNSIRFRASLDDQVTGKLGKIRDDFDRLGKTKGFKNFTQGLGMGAGIGAWNLIGDAIRGAGQYMADSISTASDLSEAMNKANVVFGKSAEAVATFADTSATKLGISKRAAYEATGMFGNLFTTMGLGQEEAAAMSVDVTKLAADLGSFHNLGIEEVFEKLRAGLVGEAEPMRTLGVMLDAATVEAKGLAMGLAETKAELTASDKVAARYALILEQTGNAQGDFGRTSDGLANSQKQLNAQMEDIQATIGTLLIPYMQEFARVLEEDVLPALQDGATWLDENKGAIDSLANAWTFITGGPLAVAKGQFDELNEKVKDQEQAARDAAGSAADLSAGLLIGASAAEEAADSIDEVAESSQDTRRELKKLEDKIRDVARTARDESLDKHYDLSTIDDKILLAKAEVASARKELEKAETDEQRAAIRIRIADAERELIDLQNAARDMRDDYGATGRLLGNSLGRSLYNRVLAWNRLTRRELARLGDSSNYGPGQNSAPPQGQALGGPVQAGRPYIVGEIGPELFVPATAGTIVPNNRLGGGGMTFVYAPVYSSATPGEAREFAARILPDLVREMRTQRVLS